MRWPIRMGETPAGTKTALATGDAALAADRRQTGRLVPGSGGRYGGLVARCLLTGDTAMERQPMLAIGGQSWEG